MESKIVYLEINDWFPTESERKLKDDLLSTNINLKTEEICVSWEVWDQSVNYWITCKRDWLEKNYPELLSKAKEKEPEHLEWKPENYGYHSITE